MSMGGRALHPPKRPRHPLSGNPLTPGRHREHQHRATRAIFLRTPPANPLVIPYSTLAPPARTAKNPAPSPRFAGPAPTAATMDPDAFGQYPAGSRSEDDPCLGLRRRRTGGALASSLSGICAT